eukprot:GHVS01043961.1.p1 GENE.GHVS01043961.1~~GHVS01043961.1.p1  ORF type:complete len:280 (+),score=50.58 GHVS01043961.1:173-1012(+)
MCYETLIEPLVVKGKKKHGISTQQLYHRMNKQLALGHHDAYHQHPYQHQNDYHQHPEHQESHQHQVHQESNHQGHRQPHHAEEHSNHAKEYSHHAEDHSYHHSSSEGPRSSWFLPSSSAKTHKSGAKKGGKRKKDRAKAATLQLEQMMAATAQMQKELKHQRVVQQMLVQQVKNPKHNMSKQHPHNHHAKHPAPMPSPHYQAVVSDGKVVNVDWRNSEWGDMKILNGGKMFNGGLKMFNGGINGGGIFEGKKEGFFDQHSDVYEPIDHSAYYSSMGYVH